jgi:VWFA-related protein
MNPARRAPGVIRGTTFSPFLQRSRRATNWLYTLSGLVLLLLLWCTKSVVARPQEAGTIRATSRLVNVDVLVTDRRTGARVDDLKREDFEILVDGRPVLVTHFSCANERERPFALVLFIEADNSIHPILPNLGSKLDHALLNLEPEDQVGVFVFDPYNLQMVQEPTKDRELVLKALDRASDLQNRKDKVKHYKKFEALPNALLAAIKDLENRQPGIRTAFVVIGSDFDVVSGKVTDDVAQRLFAAGVTVAGLLKSDVQTSAAKAILRAMTLPSGGSARAELTAYLSNRTGGETITVNGQDYGDALDRVIGDVTQRYSLAFVPPTESLDGRFHKITVRVRPEDQGKNSGKFQIRARRGYFGVR